MTKTYFVGVDLGGRKVAIDIWDSVRKVFLRTTLREFPSRGAEGTQQCIEAMVDAIYNTLAEFEINLDQVAAFGLGTPGPVKGGVIAAKGATNFGNAQWANFDVRSALEEAVGVDVYYGNDANLAAFYGHQRCFLDSASGYSSISSLIGTGNGCGAVVKGRLVDGDRGMGMEGGHVFLPAHLFAPQGLWQPRCMCGNVSDLESFCSFTGLKLNLLPFFLPQFPEHSLSGKSIEEAAPLLKNYDPSSDGLAAAVFGLQAKALAYYFNLMVTSYDPSVLLIGGGLLENTPAFNAWFFDKVREQYQLLAREEQRKIPIVAIPDGDMAGARGAALLAYQEYQLTCN